MANGSLDLLPRNRDDFRSKTYWEHFFRTRKKAFEWYGTYEEVRNIVLQSLVESVSKKVLVVGCGNSDFSSKLYDDGVKHIVNVDFSHRVIMEMRKKNRARKLMKWHVMDMTDLQVPDGEYDLVMDKGALDALAAEDTELVRSEAAKYLSEVSRVLSRTGSFICVTLGQDYILQQLLSSFPASSAWRTDVTTLPTGSERLSEPSFPLAIVCKRFGPHIVDAVFYNTRIHFSATGKLFDGSEKPKALVGRDLSKAMEYIESARACRLIRSSLRQKKPGCRQDFELATGMDTSNSGARYALTILDCKRKATLPCAVFLVPQGRENEWMFESLEGLQQLAESADTERLMVVKMLPGRVYESLEAVQQEIGPAVRDFAASGSLDQIPIMSLGESIGHKKIVARGELDNCSGTFVVEEIERDSSTFRRMVFLESPNLIQSEARLHPDGSIDAEYLCFEYHRAMLAGISSLRPSAKNMLLIGLGGGALATSLCHFFPAGHVTVCELDREVVSVAEMHFDFHHSRQRLHVIVGDGLVAVNQLESIYDVVIVDVDNKDLTIGMSCPPPEFVAQPFLKTVYDRMDPAGSLLVVNVAARSAGALETTVETLTAQFEKDSVYTLKPTEDDVNRILFAERTRQPRDDVPILDPAGSMLLKNDDEMDLATLAKAITRVNIT